MSNFAPHLQDEEEQALSEDITRFSKSQIGPQWPSKYGKWGSRLYKAKWRAGRK